ncbi:YidC/Oxa1 family membrane protein insertase [Thermoactinomyces sp. DSM 45891]|uniref:YidC/Oxa1 family membrane protein insertase n=1 Tax=Thermoactinomyces sp. DSM 45891 TaxID=1761907 RepID=UPI000912B2DE|nr:YidC/Oxa1 family membrane protein insertase [Thermoactinomyces sp. DSM 45891]SFX65105.1 YidC/Oxa1 family membrane protein insertase [Thermoactinomyces sp. DSM 45891]
MSKRARSLFAIGMMILVLTGCSTNTKLDPENSWWDRYFVVPLSDLLDLLHNLIGSYGLAILALTLIIRFAILPIAWKQQKSMMGMQKIQPELTQLREKHKKDPQKMQQEMMRLYRENNVNPAMGCLPLLLQMPVFFALYQSIIKNPHLSGADFLYLKLGAADPYHILPILAAAATFLQMHISTQQASASAVDNPQAQMMQTQMKMMKWIFPVFTLIATMNFPSAAGLYWFFSSSFSVVQTIWFNNYKKKLELAEQK